MNEYYAIIIDLVKSKGMNDNKRYLAQEKLNQSIILINEIAKENLVKSMSFSAGDSVQGLFSNIQSAYLTFYLIKHLVYPYAIRCGIGQGEINEQLIEKFKSNDSNIHDGKAYHLARSGLEYAKKSKYSLFINSEKNMDYMINVLINNETLTSMTQIQHTLYSLMNIIDPIVFDTSMIEDQYFKNILSFVKDTTLIYRKNSRVKDTKFSIDDELTDFRHNIELVLNQYKTNTVENDRSLHTSRIQTIIKNDSTISTEMRECLVSLTSSSIQNISSIILKSNMDELRKKDIAILEMINHIYGGEQQ
jgi:hypothetical protein